MARDQMSLRAGAQVVIDTCLNVKAGESLVIVADPPNQKVGKELTAIGRKHQAETVLVLFEPRKAHAEDPPAPVVKAACEADAVVFATTFSLSNANIRRQATKAGARVISLPGCCPKTLQSGAIFADFQEMEATVQMLGKQLSHGRFIHVTTEAGTDLEIRLCGRDSVDQTGMAHAPGTWSPCPNLETAIGPCEDGVDGSLVVDGAVIPGGVPRSPICVTFRGGKAVAIEGKSDALRLQALLAAFESPHMYQAVEFGIGLNRAARIGRGLMAEDESQFGTAHIGLGAGHTFGLPVSAPSHVDLVMRRPTIAIDGKIVLADECLVL
jgi:leucyl aminopeptidase (aminopeptidase T)